MTGDPGPIIVDSLYAFGVRDFDTAAALALMKKASAGGTTQGTPDPRRQGDYTQPALHRRRPVGLAGILGRDFASPSSPRPWATRPPTTPT